MAWSSERTCVLSFLDQPHQCGNGTAADGSASRLLSSDIHQNRNYTNAR